MFILLTIQLYILYCCISHPIGLKTIYILFLVRLHYEKTGYVYKNFHFFYVYKLKNNVLILSD